MRVERVESLGDPRVAFYRELREGRLLDEHGLFVAESRHVVRQLLRGGRFRVRSLLLSDAALADLRDELEAASERPLVRLASNARVREIAGYAVHQGCLALVERGEPVALDALPGGAGRGRIVAIERLADPANVGSVFRNALAFGADAVLLAPGGADPLSRKAVRVSLAATLAVPFARAREWPGALEKLRAEGYRILACVSAPDAEPLDGFDRDASRLVLLFGSEGDGLDATTLDLADAVLTIPMAHAADSLNVATASGIVLHHFARRRA